MTTDRKNQIMQNLELELNRLLHHIQDMENASSAICKLTVRQSAGMAKYYFDQLDNKVYLADGFGKFTVKLNNE